MRKFVAILSVFFLFQFSHSIHPDPSDFFLGAQHRPKLTILQPNNGQVLDDSTVNIHIEMSGYEMPSSFHDSKLCIAVSSGQQIFEDCFDQSPEVSYHASGLSPGEQYSLRVSLYERGKAIAVSVRNFRVAGIKGLILENLEDVVTIKTAVQVAVKYQTMSMNEEAEKIYRSILEENPVHLNALHLLGVVFIQKGDPHTAAFYIERALREVNASNTTVEEEVLHNSLAACYRSMDKSEEAIQEYQRAIQLNPQSWAALFNLGLTLQQLNRWNEAVDIYSSIGELAKKLWDKVVPDELEIIEEARIRECDLRSAINSNNGNEAIQCWEIAAQLFPDKELIYNELGNLYGQNGYYDAALSVYKVGVEKGFLLAELNVANILELQGFYEESRAGYLQAKSKAVSLNLPQYHIEVRMAGVLPRILPSAASELKSIRKTMENELDYLLSVESTPQMTIVDNAPPLYFGFSTGYYLLYHDKSSLVLKRKLAEVYAKMCPALNQGYFMDKTNQKPSHPHTIVSGRSSALPAGEPMNLVDYSQSNTNNGSLVYELESSDFDNVDPRPAPFNGSESNSNYSGLEGISLPGVCLNQSVSQEDSWEDAEVSLGLSNKETSNPKGPNPHALAAVEAASVTSTLRNVISDILTAPERANKEVSESIGRKIRIGFVSRYFTANHPAGILIQGLVPILAEAPNRFEVMVFHIDRHGSSSRDEDAQDSVKSVISHFAHIIVLIPLNIDDCNRVLRSADLDILIFPEIGMDPITYYLAFSRLAPVQAMWMGHPDTSGLVTVDYFLGSDVALPQTEKFFSEEFFPMRGFGSNFVDVYFDVFSKYHGSSSRTLLLERTKMLEHFNLPRAAHLYVIAQPLYSLHPDFDSTIRKLLLQDRLGYVVILDAAAYHAPWQELFVSRVAGGFSSDFRARLVFLSPVTRDDLFNVLAVAHVLLDPFPGSSFLSSLQALAVGVPVVTFPSKRLASRLTLALYRLLEYGYEGANKAGAEKSSEGSLDERDSDISHSNNNSNNRNVGETVRPLAVNSPGEYLSTALSIALNAKVREAHVAVINSRRHKLFDSPSRREEVLEDWERFIHQALKSSNQFRQ